MKLYVMPCVTLLKPECAAETSWSAWRGGDVAAATAPAGACPALRSLLATRREARLLALAPGWLSWSR
jgi:hypothetical protein